jgi:hypothetical protein
MHAAQALRGRTMRQERQDEFVPEYFNSTVFTTYPNCSMNCLEDNVRKATCAVFDSRPKLYADCVCRRSDEFQTAAAACIAERCANELRSSARKFSDNCTSSGGSTVGYDVWLAQGSNTNGVSAKTSVLTIYLLV